MRIKKTHAVAFATVALATVAYTFQSVNQVMEGGRTISTNIQLVNGRLMVPLRDVANYFGYTLQVQNGTAEMVKSADATPADPVGISGSTTTDATQTTGNQTVGSTTLPGAPEPGTAIGTTTSPAGILQAATPAPPQQLTGTVGKDVAFGDFVYRVESITEEKDGYKEQYDQRADTIKPPFKNEKLVVVRMSVTNNGADTQYPPIPSLYSTTVFDGQKVGYPATGLDARQASDVNNRDNRDLLPVSGPSVLLAKGGRVEYAVIASIPQDRSVSMVTFSVPAPTQLLGANAQLSSGAVVTVNAS